MIRLCSPVILILFMASIIFHIPAALAKIDLVTLPERDQVQTTIYNSADLTLVRDTRELTLKKGLNRLQFSWAGTRIDPTSLNLTVSGQKGDIDILQVSYPPRTKDVGIWEINCENSGPAKVDITYFTSGMSWEAFYVLTLAQDYKTAALEGFVKVSNHSGENYENAQTRLVVGKVNILDRIAELASRQYPYGKPDTGDAGGLLRQAYDLGMEQLERPPSPMKAAMAEAPAQRPKKIVKQGLSEFFLYTIEGTQTIPTNWSKRLPSFSAGSIPVENLYRHDPDQYGPGVIRFIKFKNDKAHNLGQTPLPGGGIKVFAKAEDAGGLSYVGTDQARYIPLDENVELNLGPAFEIRVIPRVTDYSKKRIMYDKDNTVTGFDETRQYTITVHNYSSLPASVEITRNIGTPHFDIQNIAVPGSYEKQDMDTVKYIVRLPAHTTQTIEYTLTVYQGERRWHR